MGSRISSSENKSNPSSSIDDISAGNSQACEPAHVYIKDQFQLEFLDCHCCCDTTKKMADCDFQGKNILRDLYEMIETPEYKLNCRCSCGDDDEKGDSKQSIKFGLTGSPNTHFTDDELRLASSDSTRKH